MVPIQNLRPEQPSHGRRSLQQPAVNQPIEVDHSHLFAEDINGSDREFPNSGQLDTTLLQIDRGGAIRRLSQRYPHLSHERAMEERCKRPRIDHQPGWRAVNGGIDVKVEAVTYLDGHSVEPPIVDSGRAAGQIRIQLHDEQLPLAVEDRLGGKQYVGSQDSVDLLFFQQPRSAGGAAKIHRDHRLIEQVEAAKTKVMGDRVSSPLLRTLGWITAGVMTIAAVAMFATMRS